MKIIDVFIFDKNDAKLENIIEHINFPDYEMVDSFVQYESLPPDSHVLVIDRTKYRKLSLDNICDKTVSPSLIQKSFIRNFPEIHYFI